MSPPHEVSLPLAETSMAGEHEHNSTKPAENKSASGRARFFFTNFSSFSDGQDTFASLKESPKEVEKHNNDAQSSKDGVGVKSQPAKAKLEPKDNNLLLAANFLFSSFNDSVKDDPVFSTNEDAVNQSSSNEVKAEDGKEKRMTYFPGFGGFSAFTDRISSNVFEDRSVDMPHTTIEMGGQKDVPETSIETASSPKKSEQENDGKQRITYLASFSKFDVDSAQTTVFANAKDEEKVDADHRPTTEDSNAVNHMRANGQGEKYQALFSVANEGSIVKDK